jgi:hypothetical protein
MPLSKAILPTRSKRVGIAPTRDVRMKEFENAQCPPYGSLRSEPVLQMRVAGSGGDGVAPLSASTLRSFSDVRARIHDPTPR